MDAGNRRTALITGASSGIGYATAKLFWRKGINVCALGRNKHALEKLAGEIEAESQDGSSAKFDVRVCDVLVRASLENVVEYCVEEFGGLDVVVASAGVLRGGAVGSETCTMEAWDLQMNTNCRSIFELLSLTVPALKHSAAKGAGGNFVVVSSVNGRQSFANLAAYCSSKAAVDMLVRVAALDLAKDGVRINSVNPGVTLTELHRRGGKTDEEYHAFLKRCETTHPLAAAVGRPSLPEEIAGAIFFLASPTMGEGGGRNMMTGVHLPVDGGRLCLGAR
jgi:NAD(P)-dependent dehydrogenase (short-subunit alcohol dehydrogenase family)